MTTPGGPARPRIAVTGAPGFLGRHVVRALEQADAEVVGLRRADVDLTDRARTHAVLADLRPDVVVHTAGLVAGIAENAARPTDFLLTNLDIGRNVVEAADAAGVRRLVNVSSSCVYPRDAPDPLTEDQVGTGPLEPTNEGYALAKVVVMRLCDWLTAARDDRRYVTLLPCNLYGPGDDVGRSTAHVLSAAVAKVCDAQVADRGEVVVWGDGRSRREFLHVRDAADAIARAAMDVDGTPERLNVGTGRDHSVLELHELVAAAAGWSGRFVLDPDRPSGTRRKLLDVGRLDAWGFRPSIDLEDGLAGTIAWFRGERT